MNPKTRLSRAVHCTLLLVLLLLWANDSTGFNSAHPTRAHLFLQAESSNGDGVRFRCGRPEDEPAIAFCMAKELMNPLGISHRNFVVAEDVVTGDRIGWAQIRPLGPAAVDPNQLNSPPGSKQTSLEEDIDDLVWEEFENDPSADFEGWQSTLPWTKEYKAAFEAAKERRERLSAQETKREAQLWELASVYVIPEKRSLGVGTKLVKSVLDQHKELGRADEPVYALTLSSTVDWYKDNFGFVQVTESKDVPKPMAFEVAAGTMITKLMGNELACLRMPIETMLQ